MHILLNQTRSPCLAFWLLNLLLAQCLLVSHAWAQTCMPSAGGNTCGHTGIASLGDDALVGAGNPIHLVSGNKYQIEVDLPALPGELGLEVVRHYNSSQAGVVGPMGAGWRLSYETRLYRAANTIQILQADGQRLIFDVDPRNPSVCMSSNPLHGRIRIEGRASVSAEPKHPRYQWEWTHGPAAGRVLHFDSKGRLERIVSASGAVVQLTRTPDGDLIRVTDPQGRQLHLLPGSSLEQVAYPSAATANRMALVSRIATPNGDIRYQHKGNALVRSSTPRGETTYQYENSTDSGLLTSLRQTVRDEIDPSKERVIRNSRWTYDDRKQAIHSIHDGQRLDIQVMRPALHLQEGLTWVRWRQEPEDKDAAGAPWSEALYRHRIIGGHYRIVEALGKACQACSPTGWRYRYDSNGKMQEMIRMKDVQIRNGQPKEASLPLYSIRHHQQMVEGIAGLTIERVVYHLGHASKSSMVERHQYADSRWPDKPTRLERPSVVKGKLQRLDISYNDAGQVTQIEQTGYSPLDSTGQPARDPLSAQLLQRTQRWTYQRQEGVSVLMRHEGPLHGSHPRALPPRPDMAWLRGHRPNQEKAWHDDFGRLVLRQSPDHGQHLMAYDETDRLVFMQDAMGHRAQYQYDRDGRLVQQDVWTHHPDNQAKPDSEPLTTRWHYQGNCLVRLEHPSQSEHYRCNARGWRIHREVIIHDRDSDLNGALRAITQYNHDESGRIQSIRLPDGSRIHLERDESGRLIGITRNRIRTPWLASLAPTATLLQSADYERGVISELANGNGTATQWTRSRERENWGKVQQITHHHAQQALLDQTYRWAPSGQLLLTQARRLNHSEQNAYAYNRRGELLASVYSTRQKAGESSAWQEEAIWRYAYDHSQRRIMSQQGVAHQGVFDQTDTLSFETSNGRLTHRLAERQHNANGQPKKWHGTGRVDPGKQLLTWDALGRLTQVQAHHGVLSSYRYDHRGLRIGKSVHDSNRAIDNNPSIRHFLYNPDRTLQAELDHQGQIKRLYFWLGEEETGLGSALPLAVVDVNQGASLAHSTSETLSFMAQLDQLGQDLRLLAQLWLGLDTDEAITWLHSNHLGAPELATDATGLPIWQARYSPFGEAEVQSHNGFQLHVRLPGQWFDEETGWHYNRQRYYDPTMGQYLSPDPLGIRFGNPDGPNPYAYVAHNPLRYVDPDGLILFAFDGTGNDESRPNQLSNVVHFRDLYAADGGFAYYITGPGTLDPRSGIRNPWYLGGHAIDMAASLTGKERVAYLIGDLNRLSDDTEDHTVIDIDVVGFSRGAAQARDFASQLARSTSDGWYRYLSEAGITSCQRLNFRFMGLWDTVLSVHNGNYELGIPTEFVHVAHAVALNEYRRLFPVESIAQGSFSATPVPGQVRIERGFVGSHSDIGGSFLNGELAKVALNWMVNQALIAGVEMNPMTTEQTLIISNPVIHDKSSNLFSSHGPAPTQESEDRMIRFRDGTSTRQRMALIGNGAGYEDTVDFIRYHDAPKDSVAGTVDMNAYLAWLNHNGYDISMTVQ